MVVFLYLNRSVFGRGRSLSSHYRVRADYQLTTIPAGVGLDFCPVHAGLARPLRYDLASKDNPGAGVTLGTNRNTTSPLLYSFMEETSMEQTHRRVNDRR